ncbi:hypothetical protein F2Q70_00027631 [Brassica cretica]|nr:hypothetical protein F2Q70_00027631 [Brassica cretica]
MRTTLAVSARASGLTFRLDQVSSTAASSKRVSRRTQCWRGPIQLRLAVTTKCHHVFIMLLAWQRAPWHRRCRWYQYLTGHGNMQINEATRQEEFDENKLWS